MSSQTANIKRADLQRIGRVLGMSMGMATQSKRVEAKSRLRTGIKMAGSHWSSQPANANEILQRGR